MQGSGKKTAGWRIAGEKWGLNGCVKKGGGEGFESGSARGRDDNPRIDLLHGHWNFISQYERELAVR